MQVEEAQRVFEEVDEEEYVRRKEALRDDDFIVDDEGFGYKDNGADIWDEQDGEQESGSKKRKKLAKDEQTMN